MTENRTGTSIFGWGAVYRLSDYHNVIQMTATPGRIHPNVAFLPPDVVEQTFEHHVWSRLNRQLGTLFDFTEDEDIDDPTAMRAVAAALRKEASLAKDDEARRVLSEAADLLDESAESGQAVVVSL
jgi:hypothetical protein